jgi:hypothetical protein
MLALYGREVLAPAPGGAAWPTMEGAVVLLANGATPWTGGAAPGLLVPVADSEWHDIELQAQDGVLRVTVDQGEPVVGSYTRGAGTTLRLGVPQGAAHFDNVEIRVPRRTDHDWVYAFDRRETGWWREGEWVDHAGIACVLASNWTSLIAPNGQGRMRHKGRVGDSVRLTVNVEENSEWYGWRAKPSHTHFAFDNVQLGLVDPATDDGYILTINALNHSTAILTRHGEEVARTKTTPNVIKFRGGHSPYHPRRLTVALERHGSELTARLNDADLLRFTDPAPLPATQVIVGGHDTRFNVARIEIHDDAE